MDMEVGPSPPSEPMADAVRCRDFASMLKELPHARLTLSEAATWGTGDLSNESDTDVPATDDAISDWDALSAISSDDVDDGWAVANQPDPIVPAAPCDGETHTELQKEDSNGNGGEDLYPRLKKLADDIVRDKITSTRSIGKDSESDKVLHEKVRYEILRRFGYFVTESSEHFAEYVPWFIKQNRQDLIDQYKIPIEEYIDRCENNIKLWDDLEKDMTPIHNQPLKRGKEYASYIMDAVANNNEVTINGNVMNDGYIDNLPSNCCVEVPCLINSNGNQPQKTGRLPEHLAALMRTNINVQILTAEAALTNKKEHIYHAAMLDPLTGANLSIDEIYSMVDKLIEAHGNYLPKYH